MDLARTLSHSLGEEQCLVDWPIPTLWRKSYTKHSTSYLSYILTTAVFTMGRPAYCDGADARPWSRQVGGGRAWQQAVAIRRSEPRPEAVASSRRDSNTGL